MSRGLLLMFAGGDPWKVNATLQSGRPAQIAGLGQGFRNAGQSSTEADSAFAEARRRFEYWYRDNGEHPINDSPDARRTITSLRLQAAQLPKIAADLENVAAALAEAQQSAGWQVATLEARLQTLDDWIGQAEDLIRQDENLRAQTDDEDDIYDLEEDISRLAQYITDCEREAVDDTKATLGQVAHIREGYADALKNAKASLLTDGYDPSAIQQLDGEDTKGQGPEDIPPPEPEPPELADIKRVTNQAVVDQMAKVRAAQKAVDDAMATAYTKGQGSPEGQAALASLPQHKKNLAEALNDLGNLPDYTNIDPTVVRTSLDGRFIFGYTTDGQPVQVTGQLKKGTGQIFDQGTRTYYTFKDGKLVGTRTLDPGRAEATDEPLLTAVTLAVGAPELKAGGEAAWQGLKTLFAGEALASGAGITSENVLPRAVAAAETQAESAAQNLAACQTEHAPVSLPPAAAAEHPAPLTTTDHPAPPGTSNHIPGERSAAPGDHAGSPRSDHHPPGVVDSPPHVVVDPGRPEFTLDNPLEIMSPELQTLSEQHLTGSGETVLGPFRPRGGGPSYIDVAQQHRASYFDIGNDAWNAATPTERLAANQHVLDIAIKNRDTIALSVPFYRIEPNSFTAAEIRYLEAHGYQRVGDNILTLSTEGAP